MNVLILCVNYLGLWGACCAHRWHAGVDLSRVKKWPRPPLHLPRSARLAGRPEFIQLYKGQISKFTPVSFRERARQGVSFRRRHGPKNKSKETGSPRNCWGTRLQELLLTCRRLVRSWRLRWRPAIDMGFEADGSVAVRVVRVTRDTLRGVGYTAKNRRPRPGRRRHVTRSCTIEQMEVIAGARGGGQRVRIGAENSTIFARLPNSSARARRRAGGRVCPAVSSAVFPRGPRAREMRDSPDSCASAESPPLAWHH